jgi:regulator of protease activity HflC (stomatin/prohibitin superfamily)
MRIIRLLFFLGTIFLLAASCSERIDAGYEGILVKMYGSDKGVQDVNLVTGRVWYNPFTESVYEFPTYVQTIDYSSFSVNAKDGSVFTVDPTISFYVEKGKTPDIFRKYRKPIEEITSTTLFNYMRDAFRIEFNKYTTDSIISSREGFENMVQANISRTLEKEGFKLEQMTSGIIYPESITRAIDAKNEAVQKAAQAMNQLRVAEANAKIKLVEAQADAEANRLRQQTLTPLLIQQQFIDKWDGKSPLYSNSPAFFKNIQ